MHGSILTENHEGARRPGEEPGRLIEHFAFQRSRAPAPMDQARLTAKGSGNSGPEVIDLDLDRRADLARTQRLRQCRAHTGVGERVDDRAVHDAVRVQVRFPRDDSGGAAASGLRGDFEADKVGKGV